MELLTSLKPERQNVDAAIQVVCDRLEHATLLEDRRAGVLSLKGFAREYKEAVTAGGLRGLLKSLTVDREDEETLKATLECLLLLFRIQDSEEIDDTALWIADEFTLRPEHVFSLLDIVGEASHHTRLHAIQILACILECRQVQLQECIASSPTGVGVLVGALDDPREVIRFEVLLLLIRLTKGHQDIQKRVAFENVFDRIKAVLDSEGGLEGGVAAADCLLLLHNLLEDNSSNQNWFRETEFFRTIASLLQSLDKTSATTYTRDVVRNCIGTMAVIRLFVKRDQRDRSVNQTACMRAGVLTQIVAYAFQPAAPVELRAEALLVLSDLLFEHVETQRYFIKASSMLVGRATEEFDNENSSPDLVPMWRILLSGASDDFLIRYAASACVYSFSTGDSERKQSIMQSIVDEFEDEQRPNLIQALLEPVSSSTSLDTWFAACMLLQLTQGDSEARSLICSMTIGDSEAGEEEVTLIQAISSNLIIALERSEGRALAGYLMLLSSWLFEAKENVADMLGESSTLQALLGCIQDAEANEIVRGLCATLVSIMYAFDFAEDTPMNRTHLQSAILRVGRTLIQRSIHKLSSLEDMYDPTLVLRPLSHPLLHPTFCDFFRDEYGTIRRAVEQRPNPPLTQAQVDSQATEGYIAELQEQLDFKSNGLNEAISHLRSRQEELSRVREELTFLKGKQERETGEMQKLRDEVAAGKVRVVEMQKTIDGLRAELASSRDESKAIAREHEVSKGVVEKLQQENESQSSMRHFLESQLGTLRKDKDASDRRADDLSRRCKAAEDKAEALQAKTDEDSRRLASLNEDLQKAKEARQVAEGERGSLKTQLRDLEQELKGERIQLETLSRNQERDLKLQRDRREEAERDRDLARKELADGKTKAAEEAVDEATTKLTKQHDTAMKQVADAHAAVVKRLEAAAATTERDHAKSTSELKKEHDAALSSLRAEHDKALAAAAAADSDSGEASKSAESERVTALEKQLESAEKQLAVSKSLLEKALRTDKNTISDDDATTTAAAAAAAAAKVQAEAEAASSKQLANLRTEHATQIEKVRNQLDALEAELKTTKERLQVAERDRAIALQERQKALMTLQDTEANGKLDGTIDDKVADKDDDKSGKRDDVDALAKMTAERDELRRQLEQAQEDLMLLMEAEES